MESQELILCLYSFILEDKGDPAMLRLLRALFNPKLPVPQEETYYQTILADPSSLLISSQLYYMLKSAHRLTETPAFFQAALKSRYMGNMMISAMIAGEMERLLKQFEHHSIAVIPFKGPLFAAKYFGSLSARSTSDLDIVVKPEQMDRAAAVIESLGFSSGIRYEPEHFHKVFHKVIPNQQFDLSVEVHWHILRKDTSGLSMDELWAASVPSGESRSIREFSDLHLFYLICLHGWNHEFNNWKYFIDIAQMIRFLGDRLDYRELFSFAAREKTYRRIAHSLLIVYRAFPDLQKLVPLPLRTGRQFWWTEAMIGADLRTEATGKMFLRRLQQLDDYDTWQQKWTFFKREVLPDPIAVSRALNTDSEKHSKGVQYLLLYVHRLVGLFVPDAPRLRKSKAGREK